MAELMANNQSTIMANDHRPSSSSALRFLGLLKQPDSHLTPLELDETDVVWSFHPSPDSYSFSKSTSPSPPSLHNNRHRFINPVQSGLSAALLNDHLPRLTSQSKIIKASVRPEKIPLSFRQSAPVNIPVWPKKFRDSFENDNYLKRFDDVKEDDVVEEEKEEEEEGKMVPPHVIVARSHVTFSVFEGAGRTLKGRDLRRVRNAVFQKTGFID